MKFTTSEKEIAALSAGWCREGLTVGFVPTMGALHRGHLELAETALKNADRVVASIFVNPTQFGRGEDFKSYPRDIRKDCSALEKLGVSAVFAPEPETIYPPGFATSIDLSGVTEGLCGAFRPGHFRGVSTVCAVLFGIVKPDIAVFGMKDAQQLAVVRRMVKDLRLGIEIIAVPIVREADGLAMSSRNAYLSPEERKQAASIHRGLLAVLELSRSGERSCSALKKCFSRVVENEPLLTLQYVETVDPDTMNGVQQVEGRVLVAAAVFAGKTRLIDNVLIEPEVLFA